MTSYLYTDWALSSKGNHWRRINGKMVSAGQKKDGTYWAMADGIFAEGNFYTLPEAKAAAESKLKLLIHRRGF